MTATTDIVEIAAGDLALALAPAIGGSLAYFRRRQVDLLRPTSAADLASRNVLGAAGYPMLPYCGRVAERTFDFGGRTYRLADNFAGHPHSIHGNGWQRPWRVVRREPAACILGLAQSAPDADWPFAYSASQIFALDESGFTFEIALRNDAAEPAPVGLGFHPFFRKTPRTEIAVTAAAIWENDARMVPARKSAIPPRFDFRTRRGIAGIDIDNGFSGWDGKAEIVWPEFGARLRIAADADLPNVVIYAPADGDFVCVEPASMVADGFNKLAQGETETGVRTLAPGEIFAARIRFDIEAWESA